MQQKRFFVFVNRPIRRTTALLALLLLFSFSCRYQDRLVEQRLPTETISARTEPAAFETITVTAPPEITSAVQASPAPAEGSCAFNPVINQIINETSSEAWLDWIEKLSGAEPVIINGEETIITTRYSPSMFSGQANARAFEYVHETVLNWYPAEQVTTMPYLPPNTDQQTRAWHNLIVTLPGVSRPDEIVILSAHLDSTSNENPEKTAPGAEDNGSGSAALLEAARLFKDRQFERTIQIIWFTGEEQGLLGSRAFVDELDDPQTVVGVVNLDMFGYDSDDDACFEIHTGTLAVSHEIGQCFVNSIDAYQLDLDRYDYLTDDAIDLSDHGAFWEAGVGAIEILENMFDHNLPNGCPNGDPNKSYHTPRDTVENLNPSTGIEIVRAALATITSLAVPID